jgi:hypothetical protein
MSQVKSLGGKNRLCSLINLLPNANKKSHAIILKKMGHVITNEEMQCHYISKPCKKHMKTTNRKILNTYIKM